MIVDLRLDSRRVLVVGGGRQATKRINLMGREKCSITVASAAFSDEIGTMADGGRISLIRGRVVGDSIIEQTNPDILVAATDDHALNRLLAASARRRGIISYCSSDSGYSDYAHLALMEFGGGIRVAVSTGGMSPAAARRIRDRARPLLDSLITPDVLEAVRAGRGITRGADAS